MAEVLPFRVAVPSPSGAAKGGASLRSRRAPPGGAPAGGARRLERQEAAGAGGKGRRRLPQDRPGFFVYRQDFRAETGIEKARMGLLGLLNPRGDAASGVYPIQEADPGQVEQCLAELQGTRVQPEIVVAGIEDSQFELQKILEVGILCRQTPDVDQELPGAERHRLWWVDNAALMKEIHQFFRGRDCLLLDGLHAYRAARRLGDSPPPAAEPSARDPCPLTAFFNLFDFGVGLSAGSFLLKEIPEFNVNEIALRLNPFFEIKTYPFQGAAGLPRALTTFREDLRVLGFTESVIGAFFGGIDQLFLFQVRDGVSRDSLYLPDVKEPLRDFDAVLLRRVILERYLSSGSSQHLEEPALTCCWSFEEAILDVRAGKHRAAFFLNPPNKRKLLLLARAGLRLPVGSVRLDPLLRFGLVVHELG